LPLVSLVKISSFLQPPKSFELYFSVCSTKVAEGSGFDSITLINVRLRTVSRVI
jgi:hypothetical protein